MLTYSILAFYYVLLQNFEKTIFKRINKKLWTFIMVLPLFILTAFKNYSVGTDTLAYKWFYEIFSYRSIFEGNNYNIEIGYRFINKLFSNFGINFFGFQIIYSFFIFYVLYRFLLKYSKNISFSIFFYITYRILFASMNVLRQTLAISIFLLSISYLKERNFKKYLAIILLAGLVHSSAFLMLGFYYLPFKKIEKKDIFKIFGLSFLSLVFFEYLIILFSKIFPKYSDYLNRVDNYDGIFVVIQLGVVTCFMLFYIFVDKITKKQKKRKNIRMLTQNRNINFEVILINALAFTYILSVMALKINIAGRLVRYFNIFLIIAIPNKLENIKDSRIRFICYMMIIVALIAYHLIIMKLRPEWDNVIPYKFIY